MNKIKIPQDITTFVENNFPKTIKTDSGEELVLLHVSTYANKEIPVYVNMKDKTYIDNLREWIRKFTMDQHRKEVED